MVVTYIINVIFILQLLCIIWFISCLIHNEGNDLSGQSDRQEKNDDYNTNYHP